MLDNLDSIIAVATNNITSVADINQLDQVRIQYLGKKGKITSLFKQLSAFSKEDMVSCARQINQAKAQILSALDRRREKLNAEVLATQLKNDSVDISLPGYIINIGRSHPVNSIEKKITSFFTSLGFDTVTGPEIEDDYHNFTALNIPLHHPARAMHDTFYFADGRLLRTHTSCVQVHVMARTKPPLRIIAPGRVYRCDSDVSHTPMFHQVEGLMIAKDVSLVQLKGTMINFLQSIFSHDIGVRFRPSYFPFTEPSMEVDIECIICRAKGCRVCSSTGWVEIMGCGIVHPQVFEYAKIDNDIYSGFAFGIGIERIAMLVYGIPDIRLLYENNINFLKQF